MLRPSRTSTRTRPAAYLALFSSVCGVALLATPAAPASAAQPSVGLGTASSFAVLAGSTVTNVGPSTISGDVGVSPGTAVTGLTSAMVSNGTIHRKDASAASAQADLTTAYNDAAGRTPASRVTANLGGQTLVAGVYAGPTLSLTGTVTLDAKGDTGAVFVFKTASTLLAANSSSVVLKNGANACNIFWQVGSSATIGTSATFAGSVLALTSISVTTAAIVQGRLLARNGAVTLDHNHISRPTCTPTAGSPTGSPTSGTTTSSGPAPSSPTTTTSSSTNAPPASNQPTAVPTTPSHTPTTTPASAGVSTPTRAAPSIAAVSPSTGPTTGGTIATVSGTGFVAGGTTVTVGGAVLPASGVHVHSTTTLTFVSPAHARGAAEIIISTSFGASRQHSEFVYRARAVASTTAPASGGTTLSSTGLPLATLLGASVVLLLSGLTTVYFTKRTTTNKMH